MADFDLSKLSPLELGATGDPGAVPYLVRFLYRGGPNERRLAASAIGKLAEKHRDACTFAAVALLDCLGDPAPQVRQYALKALAAVPLPSEAAALLAYICEEDEKPYNRAEAASLLRQRFPGPIIQGQTPYAEAPTAPVTSGEAVRDRSTAAVPAYVGARPAQPGATSISLDALNRLLEAAYGEPRRLSQLLRAAGLPDDAINSLRREHLAPYLSLVAHQLCAWVQRLFSERTADIFVRRFELDGGPIPTLEEIGKQYGVSRERARQVEMKVRKRLRSPRSHVAIERIIANAARDTDSCRHRLDDKDAPADAEGRREQIGALLAAGLAPDAIARRLGRSEDFIFYHLSSLIRQGEVALEEVLSEGTIETIRGALAEPLDQLSLSAALRRVPPGITTAQVRCVVATKPNILALFDPEAVQAARKAARAVVSDLSGELSRSAVAKILTGSPSKRVSSQRDHPGYGVFAGSEVRLLTMIVDDLIAAGELVLDEHSRLAYIEAPAQQSAS